MNVEPRDPHLLAALRHAPDRHAAPPPELTARVLAAARDAVRSNVEPSLLQRALTWLASPRLGAAFATLALAVLVGVMWSSQEPAVPASVSPELVAPQDQRETARAAAQRAAPAAPAAVAPRQDGTAAPPSPVATAPSERRLAKKEADGAVPERARDAAKPRNEASADAARPEPSAAPARAAAPAAPTVPAEPKAAAALPPAPAAPAESRADAAAAPLSAAPAAPARARSEPPPAQAGALSRQAAVPPLLAEKAASFDPLLALEAAGPAGWTWSTSAGERAHGPAQRELWAAMRAATEGRWDAAPSAPSQAPWLRLRSGERLSVLWLMNGALHLADADGRTWRASVTPEQAREWQRSVARW